MTNPQQSAWKDYGSSGPEVYERYMVPSIFGPWAVDLVKLAAPIRGERVLDVAFGTGIVARLAAHHLGPMGKVVRLYLTPPILTLPPPPSAATKNTASHYD